jgi:hypothetical protein
MQPGIAPAGVPWSLSICDGRAGSGVLLLAVEQNGMPLNQRLAVGFFGLNCEFSLQGIVPADLAGLNLDFQALGFDKQGRLAPSNRASMIFP